MDINSPEFDDMGNLVEMLGTHGLKWILRILAESTAAGCQYAKFSGRLHKLRQSVPNHKLERNFYNES